MDLLVLVPKFLGGVSYPLERRDRFFIDLLLLPPPYHFYETRSPPLFFRFLIFFVSPTGRSWLPLF